MYNIPNEIIEIARNLRKNMTFSEKILWDKIRWWKLWKKFLRQHPIYVFSEDSGLHRFIISDFYCKELNLIIEIDWEIHNIYEVSLLDREKEKILISGW
jgi:very-short-patch-repair endonuclease